MSAAAADAARAWLASLPNKTFPASQTLALTAHPAHGGGKPVSYGAKGMAVGFSAPLEADDTAATVAAKLRYIAPELGTPGLAVEGWTTRSMVPVSSFREGVEVTKFEVDGGKATLGLEAKVKHFAVAGTRDSVTVPADAGYKPDDYFQVREEFYADLTGEYTLPL